MPQDAALLSFSHSFGATFTALRVVRLISKLSLSSGCKSSQTGIYSCVPMFSPIPQTKNQTGFFPRFQKYQFFHRVKKCYRFYYLQILMLSCLPFLVCHHQSRATIPRLTLQGGAFRLIFTRFFIADNCDCFACALKSSPAVPHRTVEA